jgi:hypothetical protein
MNPYLRSGERVVISVVLVIGVALGCLTLVAFFGAAKIWLDYWLNNRSILIRSSAWQLTDLAILTALGAAVCLREYRRLKREQRDGAQV